MVRNVVANWLGMAVGMAVAFVMSPFLVHRLGDTMYGLWVLLLAMTGYMGLLDAGLKVSVVKYVSRFLAVKDADGLNRVVSTVLILHGGISVVIVAGAFAAAPVLPRLLAIPPEMVPIAQIGLVITALNVAVTLAMSVFNGVLAGAQRYDYANVIGVGVVLVRSAVIVAVVSQGMGIIGLGLVQTAANIASGLLLMRAAFKVVPDLRIRWSLIDRETVRTLYGYGSFVLLNNVAMFLLFHSAEVVIGTFLSVAAVTYYAIAGSLMHYLSQLIGVMTQVLHPYAAAQDAKGESMALRRAVVVGTKACLIIALPATITFVLAGGHFIELWMGAKYAAVAAPLIVVLSVGRLFWLAQSSSGNVLLGAGRHQLLTVANLATGILGLAFGSLLIRSMGLMGLAIGMTVPMVIIQGLVLPRLTMRAFGIPLRELVWEGYLQPLLASLPYAIALAFVLRLRSPQSLIELALLLLSVAPVLVLSMWLIAFSRDQRRAIWGACSKWLPVPATQGSR
jgi:O-antigen/teichoic acid export membrane protein